MYSTMCMLKLQQIRFDAVPVLFHAQEIFESICCSRVLMIRLLWRILMKHAAKTLIGLTVFALVLGVAGCGASDSQSNSNNDQSLVLRTYTVTDGRAKGLTNTLNNVFALNGQKKQLGSVSYTSPRQILVLAPKRMQDSIAASIKQIVGKGPHAEKPSGPLRLNAWIVDAYPDQGPAAPSLKAIRPALEAFAKAMGPVHFVQAHYLSAVSDVGSKVKLSPLVQSAFIYTINRNDGTLVLKFSYGQPAISFGCQGPGVVGLQGQVTVQPRQTLVLGLISDRPVGPSGQRCKAAHSTGTTASGAGNAAQGAARNTGEIHRLLVVRVTSANQR
jgi:hypothetical protein